MSNSIADSINIEIGDWADGNGSDSGIPTLDDVLKDVENFDESLSFLEESEGTSLVESALMPSSTPNLSYSLDPGISVNRLESQSHQLASLANKSGNATCVCASQELVAVGGSKGMVMLFNSEGGRLETFFPGEVECGSVICVSFSEDGRFLAVGYGRGIAKLFGVKKRTLLHTMKDVVQPGAGLLQVAFLHSNNDILTLDTSGNVFEVRLKSGITRRISHSVRCVFSGCNGEVLHVKVLPQKLIVLLTVTKMLIVTVQRGGSVLCVFPVGSLDSYPPLFDYTLVTEKRRKYFKVCMGRKEKLSICALYPDKFGTEQKVAVLLKVVQLPFEAISISWIAPSGVICFDRSGRSAYVNTEKGSTSRGLDQELPVIFSTSTYKAIETGGNVSEAMSALAELVCYQSVSRLGNSLHILTHDGLYTVQTNNELDQLIKYQQREDVVSPCLFLLDLIKERIRPVVCSWEKLLSLADAALRTLVEAIAENRLDAPTADLSARYRKHMQILIHGCVESGQYPVLYDFAWPRFEETPALRTAFLESLDEFVLDGQLGNAPPSLVSSYLLFLANEGHFSQLQSAICRFPIESIDLHMVMTVCRQNNLYDGVIHVMNKALLDYIGPLEEMLDAVASFAAHDVISDSEMEQGNRLLLYIQCCLAGHGYPVGKLPEEAKQKVPLDVYRCITSIRGKDGSSSSEKYPYLRTLLLFDAQQFFHVVSTCVDAPLFTSSDGRLQRLMDMLGEVGDSIGSVDVLVQYLIVTIRLLEDTRILAPVDFLERCISTLLRHPSLPENAEMIILDVLDAVPQLNREVILRLSLHPFRFQICSFVYFSQRRFVEILKAVMNGEARQMIFSAIKKILRADLSQSEMALLTQYLKSAIYEMGSIDNVQTAQLIIDNFPHFFTEMVSKVPKARQMMFPILKAAFDIRKERQETFLAGDDELDEELFDIYFEGLVEVDKWKDADLREMLIYWLPMGARSDFCLNIAIPNQKFLTSVQLLAARGLVSRAFELIFEKITNSAEENDLVLWIDELLHLVSLHPVEVNENNWLIRSFREIVKHCKNTSDGEMDNRLLILIRRIMSGGSQHAYELFSCLLDCQSFKLGDLAATRTTIKQLLSSCDYERMLLTSIFKTMEHENASRLQTYQKMTSRQTARLTIPHCYVCSRSMSKASYAYPCGHIIHLDCDKGTRQCPCTNSAKQNEAVPFRYIQKAQKRNIFANWNEELRLTP